MVVDGALLDPHGPGQLSYRDTIVALLGEELDGFVEDPLFRFLAPSSLRRLHVSRLFLTNVC